MAISDFRLTLKNPGSGVGDNPGSGVGDNEVKTREERNCTFENILQKIYANI